MIHFYSLRFTALSSIFHSLTRPTCFFLPPFLPSYPLSPLFPPLPLLLQGIMLNGDLQTDIADYLLDQYSSDVPATALYSIDKAGKKSRLGR